MKQALTSVTGLGAVSVFGLGADELWRGVSQGESPLKLGFGEFPEAVFSQGGALVEAHIRKQQPTPDQYFRFMRSPAIPPALLAAREAMQDAGWDELRADDGLLIGTTTGELRFWERAAMEFLADAGQDRKKEERREKEFSLRYSGQPLGCLLRDLQFLLQHSGPAQTIASACSASTQAIAIGAQWIASGRVKRCLVGGVELLSELTKSGFQALQLISPKRCQPFDRDRSGINLSEGAAFLCLEAAGKSQAYAALRGFGMASDAMHMTAPHPEGDGCQRAMEAALRMSGISATELSWIHAHGTGSLQNDLAESLAIRKICTRPTPVSSTKATHGHPLGAAGTLESALVCRALAENLALPNWGWAAADPAISLPLMLPGANYSLTHVLKNTLAFGGSNASLLFSRD